MNSITFPKSGSFGPQKASPVLGFPDMSSHFDGIGVNMREATAVYCRSMMEISRKSCEFGLESIEDGTVQMRAIMNASNPLEAGSLYLSYVQRRMERSAGFSRDIAAALAGIASCFTAR